MTVAEFQSLPEDCGPVYHELRNGEVVAVTRPRYRQFSIQRRLRRQLENLATEGVTDTEFAFRPSPEHELSVADVAYVAAARECRIDPDGYLEGAPDLVIEVLSPSNTASEICAREKLSLENGAKEFWVVDPDRRQIRVSAPDGRARTWVAGDEMPLALFGNAKLSVRSVFD
jgi:Uma2 family endonuclease